MVGCVVPACFNSFKAKNRKAHKVTYYSLPADPELLEKWERALGHKPAEFSVVCSDHFQPEDLDRSSPHLTKLRPGAIPCIFPKSRVPSPKDDKGASGEVVTVPRPIVCKNEPPSRVPEIPFVEVKEEMDWDLEQEHEEEEEVPRPAKRPALEDRLAVTERPTIAERPAVAERPSPAPTLAEPVAEEFESAGASVARKLARMSQLQAIYAESLISSILRRGLLNRLQEHTDICDNRCNRRAALASQSAQVTTSIPKGTVIKVEPSDDEDNVTD